MRRESNMLPDLESLIWPRILTDIDDDLLPEIDDPMMSAGQKKKNHLECDLCGKSLEDQCICNIEAAVCLCHRCFEHLEKIT